MGLVHSGFRTIVGIMKNTFVASCFLSLVILGGVTAQKGMFFKYFCGLVIAYFKHHNIGVQCRW